MDGVNLEVYKGSASASSASGEPARLLCCTSWPALTEFRSGRVEVLGYDARKSERFKHRLGLVTQEKASFRIYEPLKTWIF